jgi:hypothetical protein
MLKHSSLLAREIVIIKTAQSNKIKCWFNVAWDRITNVYLVLQYLWICDFRFHFYGNLELRLHRVTWKQSLHIATADPRVTPLMQGRATAQAVSHRVRAQVRSCGICGGQSGTEGQVFSENFGFPCQFSFHRSLHTHHLSSAAVTMGQTVADVQVDSVSPHPKELKN